MPQNIFYPSLNNLCRKFLIDNGTPQTPLDALTFQNALIDQRASLFEQFLLFDKITFKVHGENIPAAILIRLFGEKGFDELIEQEAVAFTLWTPFIGYLTNDIAGVEAFCHGSLNSPAHCDPEKSAALGLNWLSPQLSARAKRQMVRKLVRLYTPLPESTLPASTLEAVKSAFRSGRLEAYGLNPVRKEKLDNLSQTEKAIFCDCVGDIMEYRFLMARGMTSFSEYKYFSPFWETVDRLRLAHDSVSGFQQIAEIENFPNLKVLSAQIKEPLTTVAKLRQRRDAVKFRSWLADSVEDTLHLDIAKTYIESIANRKGLFDSVPAKFVKSISMAAIGAAVGTALGGDGGALFGVGLGKGILEPAVDAGLDFVIDGLALDAVARGWSPKMFFDNLHKFREKAEKISQAVS